MHQTPVVPPRPSRTTEKETLDGAMPKIPPRPVNKRIERSVSPNPDRFAPSPLSSAIIAKDPKATALGQHHAHSGLSNDAIERSGSVPMPSVGEEGVEYSAVAGGLEHSQQRSSSPEQTRTVADDLKLHAPKPSLPASSAKQQVMAVTRTDSDRAASFGIGRPTSTAEDRAASRNSVKKRPSSSFSAYSDAHTDDEQGIPEIGQRVPMNPHLGDVQAPSPGPGLEPEATKRHHGRKHSARGLPPGSYGLHGHGVVPQDKLEKAYYQKHPEVLEREHHTPLHDRQNYFAMSSSDLNRLVRDTASRQAALGSSEFRGTPTDEVAFQATEEYTSRITSRPASVVSPRKGSPHFDDASLNAEEPIHVDDARYPELCSCGDEDKAVPEEDQEYNAPILAPDEVKKDPNVHLHPAVRPHHERRGSSEAEESPSRPTSRPSSIRVTLAQPEFSPTPLEDVEEYEPLFSEEAKEEKPKPGAADEGECRHHFPSKDVWEDAPSSVHYTATVSTPEVLDDQPKRSSSAYYEDRSITPAQAFAQYQEQLAEKEATGRSNKFLHLAEEKPTWIDHQPQLKEAQRPAPKRFPSRDVWEDAPESQFHQAVLSGSPTDESKPDRPACSAKKSLQSSEPPAIPDRPKPWQNSGDDSAKQKPPVSDKPKPQIPHRPSKSSSGDSKDGSFSKPKPPVPSRPVGNKIAALQAGFMNDLNKRLQLGPQAPKKEEVGNEEAAVEEKGSVPLSDARKGRARGPQRRAPAKNPTPVTATAPVSALTFCMPQTSWILDPDDGGVALGSDTEPPPTTKAEGSREPSILDKSEVPDELSKTVLVEEPRTIDEPLETGKTQETEDKDKTKQPVQEERAEELQRDDEQPVVEGKTIATNMGGESILEATVKKGDGGNEVEPVEIDEDIKA